MIALGRLLLATLVLTAIWVDASQPSQFPAAAYALLIAYVALSAALLAVAWSSWWTDARLAGPAHGLDIVMFTFVVFLTQGDTSPYFIFCIFVLLAAAIRWGWRATALTAILLTMLYLFAGSLSASANPEFEFDRFATRTAYLVILSLILIWFGVNQWRPRLPGSIGRLLPEPALDALPLETSLKAAMGAVRARSGAFTWSKTRKSGAIAVAMRGGEASVTKFDDSAIARPAGSPFVYDLARGHALTRDPDRNLMALDPARHIAADTAIALDLREGLAIPVFSEGAEGQLYLEAVPGLSIDHVELGAEIGAAIAAHLQRQALMKAAEDSAEARSRLAIARDLHDSVVQFLAGAAFRLEAMKRSQESGRELAPELNELKQLMLQEQSELRSFISALRSGTQMELTELARDLQGLAQRLSRQWEVQCSFSVEPGEAMVPARLHLDAQQLVREAVANAVRHAGAKTISIRLAGGSDEVRLDFINDGSAFPKTADGGRMPRSLRERVESAGGALELSRGMGVTKISISLPAGKAA